MQENDDTLDLFRKVLEASPETFRAAIKEEVSTLVDEINSPIPSTEKLSRMKEHADYVLDKTKRQIAAVFLWALAALFFIILIGFVILSAYWVGLLFGGDECVANNKILAEILKTGWTVIGTVVATKFAGQIFDDKKT